MVKRGTIALALFAAVAFAAALIYAYSTIPTPGNLPPYVTASVLVFLGFILVLIAHAYERNGTSR